MVLQLQLLDVKPRLEYLLPRATLISSAADYPKKEVDAQSRSIRQQHSTEAATSGSIVASTGPIFAWNGPIIQQEDTAKKIKIVKTKEQNKELYSELFEGIGRFPGEPYHIHTDPAVTPKQIPYRPIQVHLKETFKQEINKMLKVDVIKPVHEATPWINSIVLVETKDKNIGKPKLHICLDPTNLNKAIICEPYCFCTPLDIAHKLTGATVITVSDFKRMLAPTIGWGFQFLDSLQHWNWLIQVTVMPFGATIAGDVFQRKLYTIILN